MHLRKCCVPSPMGAILYVTCMIENVISPLFPARKYISKERKYTRNNFPSNPWYDKECKSLKYVVNNIVKHRDFNARHGIYNIMLRQYKQLIQRK